MEKENKRKSRSEELNLENLPDQVEVIGVSFRNSSKVYYFSPKGLIIKSGSAVIVETARGLEYGRVTMSNKTVNKSEIIPPLRTIIRIANSEDAERNEANRRLEEEAMRICKKKVAEHKLEMNMVDVEYTFDNQKLLFYFTSEGRVDFRDLVKDLAGVFKTRIELRQIGIRDEAKMLGGLGICGRPFCCSSFLPDFVQVTIKMAKEQNFSLNSAKVSGACGRLMCCLRYEHETYEAAIKTTPSVGSIVSTANGQGVVIETRPLEQCIRVRLDDKQESPKLYACTDVKVLKGGKQNQVPVEPQNTDKNKEN
ncbi:MAG: stage 0 sporulation family protein [Clostridia bacterium]|nr:stage 0 sporulation family protein [Clostridia bacterium]